MKTEEVKTDRQQKKSAKKPSGSKKASGAKYVPTEEEIREKAREIYFERIARGERGTAEDDWREAEELLTGY